MSDETNTDKTKLTQPSRRDIVTKAAQVAVTAPAVAVLLNAGSRNAFAQISLYIDVPHHVLDDFTFGNAEEDIDALNFGSNFNPTNGLVNLDDHIF